MCLVLGEVYSLCPVGLVVVGLIGVGRGFGVVGAFLGGGSFIRPFWSWFICFLRMSLFDYVLQFLEINLNNNIITYGRLANPTSRQNSLPFLIQLFFLLFQGLQLSFSLLLFNGSSLLQEIFKFDIINGNGHRQRLWLFFGGLAAVYSPSHVFDF